MANPRMYSVGSAAGRSGYAATLTAAKVLGARIAKLEAWKGMWNISYITLTTSKQKFKDGPYYDSTGWEMYVPVRGTGRRAEDIIAEIKRRKGVAPMRWTKKR